MNFSVFHTSHKNFVFNKHFLFWVSNFYKEKKTIRIIIFWTKIFSKKKNNSNFQFLGLRQSPLSCCYLYGHIQCFDLIDHMTLLQKLNRFTSFNKQVIKSLLSNICRSQRPPNYNWCSLRLSAWSAFAGWQVGSMYCFFCYLRMIFYPI